MRKIHDVLRLHLRARPLQAGNRPHHQGLSSTVSDYVARAQLAGLSSPLPAECDDATLKRLLFPPSEPSSVKRPAPAWATVHNELRRKGVTLELLWQEC